MGVSSTYATEHNVSIIMLFRDGREQVLKSMLSNLGKRMIDNNIRDRRMDY